MTSAIATLPESTTAVESADEQWTEADDTESPVRVSPRGLQMLSILNGLFDEQQPATTDK